MVSHRFSAIFMKSAGKNFRVGPGVVIGRNGNGFPTIGNNVYIAANSTVIGGIEIGDNVIIGAGYVVTKDVPSNSVVVGNPARVIRSIEEKDLKEIDIHDMSIDVLKKVKLDDIHAFLFYLKNSILSLIFNEK